MGSTVQEYVDLSEDTSLVKLSYGRIKGFISSNAVSFPNVVIKNRTEVRTLRISFVAPYHQSHQITVAWSVNTPKTAYIA